MSRTRVTVDESTIEFEIGEATPSPLSIVERKGHGHPDTLADHLAEHLSVAYSRCTHETFGAVLHHNFDKLALLGGACEVRYGGGQMLDPVRVLVNGRAAGSCGGSAIPVDEIIVETVRGFFHDRLPELDEHLKIELNVTSNSSPGAVHTDDGSSPERTKWFEPSSVEDLRERQVRIANDTSLGTGYAPASDFERFVKDLVDRFTTVNDFTLAHPWCGSDVKLMGYATTQEIDVVTCVPQKSSFVSSRAQYLENKETVAAECRRLAAERFPELPVNFRINVRDIPERDELYLTLTGSSIESGDEGVVGRGNRVSGLITPLRPMNVEGANGKNPVYHVGKLYNVAAVRLAQALHEATGDYAEVHLVSATGQRLDRPWRVLIRLAVGTVDTDAVMPLVMNTLNGFPALTDEILADGLVLS
ncbi:methionine adenosyltransferase [Catenulispora yoronensis]|uniref:Methionine adenosyltransferase n=1 Tax=Catenulispora yoronensis TaxID=450799 RepID=A0ABP5FPJ7_9ACTN